MIWRSTSRFFGYARELKAWNSRRRKDSLLANFKAGKAPGISAVVEGLGSIADLAGDSGSTIPKSCVGMDVLHQRRKMLRGAQFASSFVEPTEGVLKGTRTFNSEQAIDSLLHGRQVRVLYSFKCSGI